MTKERPILFSTPMVQALLHGRKTQTRRIIKTDAKRIEWMPIILNGYGRYCDEHGKPIKPKVSIGDVLWVRETWQYVDFAGENNGYVYRATDPDWETMEEWTWKPSLFMPKKACRLFLKVTDVTVERLHDISENDANAEGANPAPSSDLGNTLGTYRQGFENLWVNINGQESWSENPFVWVITFERVERPSGFC